MHQSSSISLPPLRAWAAATEAVAAAAEAAVAATEAAMAAAAGAVRQQKQYGDRTSASTVACPAAQACLHFVHEHRKRSVPQRLGQVLDLHLSVTENGPAW